MNPLRKTLFAAAAAGTLFLSAAVSPVFAAPTAYQATGPILEMTDTTITIMFKGSEKWTFSKDAATSVEGLKVGDRVTVHYTMAAGSIEAAKTGAAAAKGKTKKTDKAPAATTAPAATAAPTAAETEAQKPVTDAGPAASPVATPGH